MPEILVIIGVPGANWLGLDSNIVVCMAISALIWASWADVELKQEWFIVSGKTKIATTMAMAA